MFDIIVFLDKDGLILVEEYGQYSLAHPRISYYDKWLLDIVSDVPENSYVNALIMDEISWNLMLNNHKKILNSIIIIVNCDKNICGTISANSFGEALSIAQNIVHINRILVLGSPHVYHEAISNENVNNLYMFKINAQYPESNVITKKLFFPFDINLLSIAIINSTIKKIKSVNKFDLTKGLEYKMEIYLFTNEACKMYKNTKSFKYIKNIKPDKILPLSKPSEENQYFDLIKKIYYSGLIKESRNGFTKSIFGAQMIYHLETGYPISTLKRSWPKTIFEELMWMIRGQTDNNILIKNGVHIWDKNSSKEFLSNRGLPYSEGDIGPGYGFQMRYFGAKYVDCKTDYSGLGTDQLSKCIDMLKNDPESRRIIINLWNASDIDIMALPCCHIMYHFTVDLYPIPLDGKRGKLNCHLFQRSWDILLGWNTTTAALLVHLLASHCDLTPGTLVHSISDVHIYKKHIAEGVIDKLLQRTCREMPKLTINKKRDRIEDYQFHDLTLENYYPCPLISMEMVS